MVKLMAGTSKALIIPDEVVINKILLTRGKKVMIDKDIAELYGVPTRRLNEQVKHNKKRFPEDFMFRLTAEEKDKVVANCDHLRSLKYSPNLPPNWRKCFDGIQKTILKSINCHRNTCACYKRSLCFNLAYKP